MNILPETDFTLTAEGPITKAFLQAGVTSFTEAVAKVRGLMFGRISDRSRPELVLTEQCGTCSTKHKLLCQLAREHDRNDVQLMEAIFKMSELNVPGIGTVLEQYGLTYIPEAHNYIRVDAAVIDATAENLHIDFARDVLQAQQVPITRTVEEKEQAHKAYLAQWRETFGPATVYTTDQLWQIREACIAAVSNKK
jgi:hypothetical protein